MYNETFLLCCGEIDKRSNDPLYLLKFEQSSKLVSKRIHYLEMHNINYVAMQIPRVFDPTFEGDTFSFA
jgi:hypothetical protein